MHEMPGSRIVDAGTTPRVVFRNTEGIVNIPGPLYLDEVNAIDGANLLRTDEIRAGWMMAKVTATKKWVPVKRSTAVGAGAAVTALTVVNASAFKVGETLQIGATTGIIAAINYSTNVITLTVAKTWNNLDAVYAITSSDGTTSLAGSESAHGILTEGRRLLSGVPFETILIAKDCTIAIGGYLETAGVLGDVAAVKADAGAKMTGFLWSDIQQ